MSLKRLDYLSRSQIQKLHRLKSDRNAQRVLKNMGDFLNSFKDGENIYYLNEEGRERVGATKVMKKTTQARHYIMRNTLFIGYGCPSTWKNEVKLEVKGKVTVVADAIFKNNNQFYIIEVDHTQKMVKNKGKIERYKKLMELNVFEKQPKFIWITTTELRRKQLQTASEGLDVRVYTVKDFI
ncbi:replication-relaxation family protein [Mesobacillus sp. S13]|uniref:replication-relaxation family protein n=1 Tax=Mesobacillus sp. S13 TaxID=2880221 RepID=UPI001CF50DE0|nr:replication-relaxation family protein [Mesobacillus sp. S13]